MQNTPINNAHTAFIDEISQTISRKQIYTDFLSRYAYGTDASYYRYVPQVVVRAHNELEIIALIHQAKKHKVSLTFRASGTSLSGQASTESVLVLVGDEFLTSEILDNASKIRLGSMVIGAHANKQLLPYGKKIGPDPASINTARIGGILANNSSGMCCGTKENSYHTMHSLRVILADGSILDTSDPTSIEEFTAQHKDFLNQLSDLAQRIKEQPELAAKVRHKYRLKNTTGYGINALVDFEDPIDILSHLLIGSEGTLGFISEVIYKTVENYSNKASAFVFFDSLENCCNAVSALRLNAPVNAVELLDAFSIRCVGNEIKNLPEFFYTEFSDQAACLLIETTAATPELLDAQIVAIDEILAAYQYSAYTQFQKDPKITDQYWYVRKGLLPIVAGARPKGANVITEDVVFPIEHLAAGVMRLLELFSEYGYHEGMVMGHALEGNLHFVLTPLMITEEDRQRFDGFMQAMTQMVAVEFGGSLKGEHGTGRSVAPFVRTEWGDELYAMMQEIKHLFDPENILNPGVIINDDPLAHVMNVKQLPVTDSLINDCIECGFCEPACPSDGLSLTPRQRISVHRNLQSLKADNADASFVKALETSYQYLGIDTCATTGMCSFRCPLSINTGEFIKQLKPVTHSYARDFAQKNMSWMTSGGRLATTVSHTIGIERSNALSKRLHQTFKTIPIVPVSMPKAAKVLEMNDVGSKHQPKVVYFVSCINRTLAEVGEGFEGTAQHTLNLFAKAGYQAVFPERLSQLCCGQPFDSKKDQKNADKASFKLNDALLKASNNGEYPIYIDNAPCALKVFKAQAEGLIDERLTLYNSAEFLAENVLSKLTIEKKLPELSLHIPCSTKSMHSEASLTQLAQACSDQLQPSNIDCCGFAGDKGFVLPELNQNGLRNLQKTFSNSCAHGVSMSKTCQIGLSSKAGFSYLSIEALLDQCSN